MKTTDPVDEEILIAELNPLASGGLKNREP